MSIIEKAVDKMMGKLEPAVPAQPVKGEADAMPVASDFATRDGSDFEEDGLTKVEKATSEVLDEPSDPVAKDADPVFLDAPTAVYPLDAEGPGENVLSIRSLGLEGVLSPDSERSRTAEEYRMIKRPLLTRAFGTNVAGEPHRNLIMVTSSVEGEGKTFSSLNLAISIAMEMDRTVLLVDADLAKPGLSRLLKISNQPGLTDRLIDETLDLRDLLIKTDIPKMSILPAGRRHKRSTELLASNVMRNLLDELALRYSDRIVLFDSPPLLATSESSVLADQMGQICLVVESGVTPQFLVKDAIARLQSLIMCRCY